MLNNKKFGKLAVLSLLGLLTLTSCSSDDDEIFAKPSNYDDQVVAIDDSDSKDLQNNVLSIIYDAMHDGSVTTKVLDEILYRYAESVFGAYSRLTLSDKDKADENVITLKEAAADASKAGNSHPVADKFIQSHKAFWLYNDKNEHINDDDKTKEPVVVEDDSNFTPCQSERENVKSKWDAIETRIAEAMYSRISSHVEKHFFNESKLLKSLYESGEKVNYYGALNAVEPMIVDYTLEGKDVFKENVLHRAYYQSNYQLNDTDYSNIKYRYVEDKIVPDVYNDLLIEQYLLDEALTAVRNSRARQINVIKIEKYSNFQVNADLLVQSLVDDIYANKPEGEHVSIVDEDNNPFESLFETYATISKGLYDEINAEITANPTGKVAKIIEKLQEQASDVYEVKTGEKSGKKYYNHTTYGDLVEEYEELLSATSFEELDKSLYSKYSDNGSRTIEEGFDQEVISIDQTQSITKGWYIKNSAPSLPSAITDILFNISVANTKVEVKDATDTEALAEIELTDRFEKVNGVWAVRDEAANKENKFLCSINGSYFLKFEGKSSQANYKNDIVYDDGSAYYIVQVLEAVKDVKLRNSESEKSYANTRSQAFLNKVIDEVTKKVGATGNYASLSKEHWLEKMDIKYHDQNVYDYFKENYPDLFEDEDE